MSYETKERSEQDGHTISFYNFRWGNTIWRYTSADRDLELDDGDPDGPHTYSARAMDDSGMTQGGNDQNDFTVKAPPNLPICDLFRSTPPSETIWLTVRRKHRDDPEVFVHWVGTVANIKGVNLAISDILCRSLLSSFKRSGLRLCWTRGCPHFLYDKGCRVDPEDFAVDAEIVSVSGADIVVTMIPFPEGYFNGGFLSWEANADLTIDRRTIEQEIDANTFRLFGSADRLEVGMSIKMYPGCDLSTPTCEDKFDNLPNYGGLEQMSGSSPFDGTPIF